MIVPRPATTAEDSSGSMRGDENAFKHVRAHGEANFANLSSDISKRSGLGLDLALSVKAVGVGRSHRLPHRYFRASAVNPQQVLPRLLRDLAVVCTWREETRLVGGQRAICFSRHCQMPPDGVFFYLA